MAGDVAVTWFGPEPRVIVNDPKMMREILANKHGQFGKQKSILWVERLLANGLTTHQGDKWATHRRIINHAFHLEKLKVTSFKHNHLLHEFNVPYLYSAVTVNSLPFFSEDVASFRRMLQ